MFLEGHFIQPLYVLELLKSFSEKVKKADQNYLLCLIMTVIVKVHNFSSREHAAKHF